MKVRGCSCTAILQGWVLQFAPKEKNRAESVFYYGRYVVSQCTGTYSREHFHVPCSREHGIVNYQLAILVSMFTW